MNDLCTSCGKPPHPGGCRLPASNPAPSGEETRRHADYLASDEFRRERAASLAGLNPAGASENDLLNAVVVQRNDAREEARREKARADDAEARLSNARRSAETFAKDLRESRAALASARLSSLDYLQTRVGRWVRSTFTDGALTDRWERAARVVEEAVELGQAEGLSGDEAIRLLSRVYARPAGEVEQEAGGLAVCLLAWAAGRETSLAGCAVREIDRIETPGAIAKIRKKQIEKALSGTGRNYAGLVVCEHCPEIPHRLNEDGSTCRFPRPIP